MLQPAFDTYAREYDLHFTNTLTGKAQRHIVHDYLVQHLQKNLDVLEINCGTGEDALFISQRCKSVLATDQSGGMIAVAREKLRHSGQAEARILDINHIHSLDKTFDLLFSNFGGINCLNKNELEQLSKNANLLLKENGEAIFVIMPQKCVWETLYFSAKLNFRKAFRRGRDKVKATLNESTFNTYYYSPRKIQAIFSNHFDTVKILPVGFFIPPSYLNSFFGKRPNTFSVLEKLEKKNRVSFLAPYSDHYLIHLKKKR